MPLHPVPIILGTTLVISGGIAFKKFIYDPHVAPFIEALIAAHHQASSQNHRQRIPVASSSSSAPTYASTTARRDRAVELRRRRRSSHDHESREGLLRPFDTEIDHARGQSALYELQNDTPPRTSPPPSPPLVSSRQQKTSTPTTVTLIDLDVPTSKHDAEVREVIFNQPTSILSRGSTPAETSVQVHAHPLHPLTPDIHASPSQIPVSLTLPGQPLAPSVEVQPPESTTFSFLSLSQASSPVIDHPLLSSLTFGSAADEWAHVRSSRDRRAQARAREEDMMSLPETSTSGYEDAEAYSSVSGSVRSPVKIHSELNRAGRVSPSPARGLELSTLVEEVELRGQSLGDGRRGPMSVVSLSESEGWGGESDWEARSQY